MALWDDPIAHLTYRRAAGEEGYRRYLDAHPASAAHPWVPEVQRLWGLPGAKLRYAMSATPDGETIAVLIRTGLPQPPGGGYVSGGRLHLATWSAKAPRWTLRRRPHLEQGLEGFFQRFYFFLLHRPYDFVLEDTSGGSSGAHCDLYYRLEDGDLKLVEKICYLDDSFLDDQASLIILSFYFGSLVLLGAIWILLYIFPPPVHKLKGVAAS